MLGNIMLFPGGGMLPLRFTCHLSQSVNWPRNAAITYSSLSQKSLRLFGSEGFWSRPPTRIQAPAAKAFASGGDGGGGEGGGTTTGAGGGGAGCGARGGAVSVTGGGGGGMAPCGDAVAAPWSTGAVVSCAFAIEGEMNTPPQTSTKMAMMWHRCVCRSIARLLGTGGTVGRSLSRSGHRRSHVSVSRRSTAMDRTAHSRW